MIYILAVDNIVKYVDNLQIKFKGLPYKRILNKVVHISLIVVVPFPCPHLKLLSHFMKHIRNGGHVILLSRQ
jgi:hypothetical protein